MPSESLYSLQNEIAHINKKIESFEDDIHEATIEALNAAKRAIEARIQKIQMEQELLSQFQQHVFEHKQKLVSVKDHECMDFIVQLTDIRNKLEHAYEGNTGDAIQEDFKLKSNQFHDLVMDLSEVINTCKVRGLF